MKTWLLVSLVAVVFAGAAGGYAIRPLLDRTADLDSSGLAGHLHGGHGGADDAEALHGVHERSADNGLHDGHDGAAGADEHALHGGAAGDGPHAQTGMDRPRFPAANGTVPSSGQGLERVSSITLDGDRAFTPSNGVRSGAGTMEDPYVITGLDVTGALELLDTDACVEVKENYIDGQLSLNWNGQCLWVHHNYIRDLRVNENVARTGYATGGLLELNKISVIGQLRHYDGEFRNNVVGPREANDLFDTVLETTLLLAPDLLVANVDGFNQGLLHHNTFYGSVDLDLHGHHHGTGFFAPHSHYHGDNATRLSRHDEDHSDRWTSVAFTDNILVDPEGYGLRYEDENHAGDDRTASSETVEALEAAHVHHTQIVLARNQIEGGGIWVDIFNADDDLHHERNPGTLEIVDNTVELQEHGSRRFLCFFSFSPSVDVRSAIQVWTAKEVELRITGNTLTWTPESEPDPVMAALEPVNDCPFPWGDADEGAKAIRLEGVNDADVTIGQNRATGFAYGVYARQMDNRTQWRVTGNEFKGASEDVWYDETVANEPQRR